MIDLLISGSTNDIVVTGGELQLVSEDAQIRQAIQQALQMFYGEWFLDNKKGVPWLQQVFITNPNLDVIQAILVNTVLSVEGVASLNSFEFDYTPGNRNLSVTLEAVTTNGQTINVENVQGI